MILTILLRYPAHPHPLRLLLRRRRDLRAILQEAAAPIHPGVTQAAAVARVRGLVHEAAVAHQDVEDGAVDPFHRHLPPLEVATAIRDDEDARIVDVRFQNLLRKRLFSGEMRKTRRNRETRRVTGRTDHLPAEADHLLPAEEPFTPGSYSRADAGLGSLWHVVFFCFECFLFSLSGVLWGRSVVVVAFVNWHRSHLEVAHRKKWTIADH